MLATVALLALALLPSALAVAQTKVVQPGQIWEVNVELTAGQRVPWNITLDTSTTEVYDIHTHDKDNVSKVTYFDHGTFNRTISGTFVAPADNLYSWTVSHVVGNDPFTATVDVSPQPPEPPKTPFPALPLLLAGALGAALLRRRA